MLIWRGIIAAIALIAISYEKSSNLILGGLKSYIVILKLK